MTCCVAGGMSKHVELVLAYAGWGGFKNAFLSDEGGCLHKISLVVIETQAIPMGVLPLQTAFESLPLRPFMCSCRLVVFCSLAFSRGCF